MRRLFILFARAGADKLKSGALNITKSLNSAESLVDKNPLVQLMETNEVQSKGIRQGMLEDYFYNNEDE